MDKKHVQLHDYQYFSRVENIFTLKFHILEVFTLRSGHQSGREMSKQLCVSDD